MLSKPCWCRHQTDKTGDEAGRHASLCLQHNKEALYVALWSDNNIMATLLTYHSPNILEEGTTMMWKKKDTTRKQKKKQYALCCLEQNKSYSKPFSKIDQSNKLEEKYKLKFESHLHNWNPKYSL